MIALREIVPNIFTWSEFSGEKQIDFNGHYLALQGESVLIDPANLNEGGFEDLRRAVAQNVANPLRAILLTNAHHDRMSQKLREAFSVPVFIHEKDRDLLEFTPDGLFNDGERLFCGLKVLNFQNQKTPGESGFLHEERRTLIVGDALIGRVPGKLNLLPPDKYKDPALAKKGLEVLRNYDFDTLLVGDGHSILSNAKKCVEEFLK